MYSYQCYMHGLYFEHSYYMHGNLFACFPFCYMHGIYVEHFLLYAWTSLDIYLHSHLFGNCQYRSLLGQWIPPPLISALVLIWSLMDNRSMLEYDSFAHCSYSSIGALFHMQFSLGLIYLCLLVTFGSLHRCYLYISPISHLLVYLLLGYGCISFA